jgi:hypothetical protein
MLDMKQSDPREEARRTATLLDAVAREAERLGLRQQDPAMRRALLSQVKRAREDAAQLRTRIGS